MIFLELFNYEKNKKNEKANFFFFFLGEIAIKYIAPKLENSTQTHKTKDHKGLVPLYNVTNSTTIPTPGLKSTPTNNQDWILIFITSHIVIIST